jgi:hypothetical protein
MAGADEQTGLELATVLVGEEFVETPMGKALVEAFDAIDRVRDEYRSRKALGLPPLTREDVAWLMDTKPSGRLAS